MAVAAKKPEDTFESFLTRNAVAYLEANKVKKAVEESQKEPKNNLTLLAQTEGEQDAKGHRWLYLDEDIDGVKAFQLQRRVSREFQPEAAEEIARAKGIYERLFPLVPTFDDQELAVAYNDGIITDDDIKSIYLEKEPTFVLTPVKRGK